MPDDRWTGTGALGQRQYRQPDLRRQTQAGQGHRVMALRLRRPVPVRQGRRRGKRAPLPSLRLGRIRAERAQPSEQAACTRCTATTPPADAGTRPRSATAARPSKTGAPSGCSKSAPAAVTQAAGRANARQRRDRARPFGFQPQIGRHHLAVQHAASGVGQRQRPFRRRHRPAGADCPGPRCRRPATRCTTTPRRWKASRRPAP